MSTFASAYKPSILYDFLCLAWALDRCNSAEESRALVRPDGDLYREFTNLCQHSSETKDATLWLCRQYVQFRDSQNKKEAPDATDPDEPPMP